MFQNFTGIVEFVSANCAPCKELAPVITGFCKDKKLDLSIVDMEAQPEIAEALGIRKAPTLVYFKDGGILDFTVGLCTKSDLDRVISAVGLAVTAA